MKNEKGATQMELAIVLFLIIVVAVIVVFLMLAGDIIGTGETIRKADENVSKTALKACREVCKVTYGPGGNFENRENLAKCYTICGK